jgi:alpha-L-rhamnosidase
MSPEPDSFDRAVPVWPRGLLDEMNLAVGFRTRVPLGRRATIRVATSGVYRLFADGRFLGFGPARTAHGHARVDEWSVQPGEGTAQILLEVVAPNINSYYVPQAPGFLQAEVRSDGDVVAWTGRDFEAFLLPERIRRVERYSVARTFSEAYRLDTRSFAYRTDSEAPERIPLEICPQAQLLPRRVAYPAFEIAWPVGIVSAGSANTVEPASYHRDWTLDCIGPDLLGFAEADLEVIPSLDIQRFVFREDDSVPTVASSLVAGRYVIHDFGCVLAGFIGLRARVSPGTTIYLLVDEILSDGDVDWKRLRCNNVLPLNCSGGSFAFESMEPYAFRYLKVFVAAGEATELSLSIRRYENPEAVLPREVEGPVNRLLQAALATFRPNAVDLYTDCPSRERAGWLCDSFFLGRAERLFTGDSRVEKAFLENYRLHRTDNLPAGMLPMCYPADHPNGKFIPNWALWYVLQLEEYLARTSDEEEVLLHQPLVNGVLEWFVKYENEYGLLEALPGWIFVEWSMANEFVQDVNFPTNMLYAAALDAAGRLQADPSLGLRAARIRRSIQDLAFDGRWFSDNALREDGVLLVTANRTEVCQYYALYFGVGEGDLAEELWSRLRTRGAWETPASTENELHPANALNGMLLRFELLHRRGLREQMLHEALDFYLPMAERTGTLWEHHDTSASCCHGFASAIACLILR